MLFFVRLSFLSFSSFFSIQGIPVLDLIYCHISVSSVRNKLHLRWRSTLDTLNRAFFSCSPSLSTRFFLQSLAYFSHFPQFEVSETGKIRKIVRNKKRQSKKRRRCHTSVIGFDWSISFISRYTYPQVHERYQ